MNAATSNNQPGQDPSTTIGVGGVTSGQSGATPHHETQQETGGSGGEQLTASQGDGQTAARAGSDPASDLADNVAPDTAPVSAGDTAMATPRDPAEPSDTSMHSGARGAFDTRSSQAGGTGTGIGSPESGANQSPADLAPPSRTDGKPAP